MVRLKQSGDVMAMLLISGNSCWSCCRMMNTALDTSSGSTRNKASSNWSIQRQFRNFGAFTKINPAWTMKQWGVHSGIIYSKYIDCHIIEWRRHELGSFSCLDNNLCPSGIGWGLSLNCSLIVFSLHSENSLVIRQKYEYNIIFNENNKHVVRIHLYMFKELQDNLSIIHLFVFITNRS